ncbi:prefoldin subunit alpha [Acidianus sulfidivorans JP7]|uniref:Prefoldin subunit alpha n=1 Tax=Acidianus sulfidivorans JP7 TaxID=619593 RepID=A0A2U9IQR2_9CREN|nr:prefoldin subunit alpha [Acidianus sulfidivorans]AWR98314.1 prefoldin subunit alpha [Acidianus sulfidivorans JP7]
MSENQGKIVVSLEDLLAQADLLKKQIDELQKAQEELAESLASINAAKDSIEELSKQQEMLIASDKKGYLMFRVEQQPQSKVLVYLGLSYYAEVELPTAIKILESRENELNQSIQDINSKLSESINAYSQIAEILRSIQQQAPKKGE